jgi:molybdopterin synthase sulfur carrier subunit
MTLHLIYFAVLRDILEKGQETLVVPFAEGTVESLVQHLLQIYPRLSMEGVRVAVNEEFSEPGLALRDGDVVALIPPVSGG